MSYNKTTFIKSAQYCSQLPPDDGIEIAIAGRSNSGKSTALNTITGINKLARTSKTPGRTQLINCFLVRPNHRLIDLPGYGYAKVPDKVKQQWENSLTEYFTSRHSLKGLLLIMDIRHPLTPFDLQMIEFATHQNLLVHILLTKADKLKKNPAKNTFFQVQKFITENKFYKDTVSVQLFSALKRLGVDDARAKLEQWFTA